MKWLVRFYVKQIYHTTIDAETREEAEAELFKDPVSHADEFNHFGSETAVIGIRQEEEPR